MKASIKLTSLPGIIATMGLLLASCAPAVSPAPTPSPWPARTPLPRLALTPTPSVEMPKYGGSVTRVRERYPDTFDPHHSRGAPSWGDIMGPIYSGLFKLDRKMEIASDLVEKWEQPSDVEYVLRLRQGIKFHDTPVMKGRELTAEDVKWNIQRMATNDPKFFRRFQFQTVSSIDVLDKYTVKLTLKERTGPFMHFMAQPYNYIVGREAVEKSGDLSREEAGTGPFYLRTWTEKVSYKLAKHPNYFVKGIPYLDEVNVIIVPDPASRLAAFRSGRVDYVLVSHNDLINLKKTHPRVTSSVMPTEIVFLTFHPEKKPFSDQRVRQAFSLAIDRQAVIDVAMDGAAELIGPIYGVADSWRLPQKELKRLYKPDIPQAKKLMAEAGYPDGFPIEVKVSSRRPDSMDALTIVADQLRQIGVDVKQQVLEHTTLVAQRDAADYVALMHGGTAALEPAERIEQYWRPGGMYHMKDSDLAKLLDEQRRESDMAKRKQILNRFERLMIDRAHVLFLFGYGEYLVRQPHIKGPMQPSGLSQHLVAYNWIER